MKKFNKPGLRGFIQKDHPFEEVKVVSFEFENNFTREEIAYIQYQLLLNKNILQAHLDYFSKKGKIIGLAQTDFSEELKKYAVHPKFELVEWITYKEVLERNKK